MGAGQLLLELDRVVHDPDAGRAHYEAAHVHFALLRAADDRVLQPRFGIHRLFNDLDDAAVANLEVALVTLGTASALVSQLMQNTDEAGWQIALATIAGSSRKTQENADKDLSAAAVLGTANSCCQGAVCFCF